MDKIDKTTKMRLGKLQIILITLCAVLLLWFIAPLFQSIFNAGNALGIALTTAAIFIVVYWEPISAFTVSLWHDKHGKIFLSLLCAVIVVFIGYFSTLTVLMIRANFNSPPPQSTLIVLGCSVKGTTPSLLLEDRLKSALVFLEENEESKCVLSGGQGKDEDISEAQAMFIYLSEHGIDESRLFLEDKSTDTFENIKFSKEIIDNNLLDENVAIATQSFHMYRASIIAKKANMKSYSVSASTRLYTLATYYVRELLGLTEEIFLK